MICSEAEKNFQSDRVPFSKSSMPGCRRPQAVDRQREPNLSAQSKATGYFLPHFSEEPAGSHRHPAFDFSDSRKRVLLQVPGWVSVCRFFKMGPPEWAGGLFSGRQIISGPPRRWSGTAPATLFCRDPKRIKRFLWTIQLSTYRRGMPCAGTTIRPRAM